MFRIGKTGTKYKCLKVNDSIQHQVKLSKCPLWAALRCIFLLSLWPHVPDHVWAAVHEEIDVNDEGNDGAVCALCCLSLLAFRELSCSF